MFLQQLNVGLYDGLEHLFTAIPIILVVRLIIRQSTLQRKNSAPRPCFKYRTNRYKHIHGTKFFLKAKWPPPGQELLCSLQTTNFHYHVHKDLPIMSRAQHIQSTSSHRFFQMHFNIILQFISRSF